MRYFRRAIENNGLDSGEAADMVPETAAELSDGITSAVEDEAEINTMVGEINEGADAADQVEATSEVFESTLDPSQTDSGEAEGASQETVAVAQESINRILLKIGIPTSRVLPSLESFSGRSKSSRITATRLAIEGFKETVKTIWTAIKNMFKNLWEKIKGFFAKFFANAEKLEKRAKEIKKTIYERTTGKKKPTDKIKSQGIATKLQDKDGKCTPASALATVQSLIKLGKFPQEAGASLAKLISDNAVKVIEKLRPEASPAAGTASPTNDAIATAISEDIGKLQTAVGDTIDTIFSALGTVAADQTAKIKDAINKEFEGFEDIDNSIKAVGPLVDGKYLICKFFKKKIGGDNDATKNLISSMTFTLTFENPFDKKAEESMEAMDPTQMDKVCEAVVELALSAQAIKKEQRTAESILQNGVKLAESAIAMAEKSNENASQQTQSAIKVVKGIVTSVASTTSNLTVNLPITMVFGGSKALDYVVASMKMYKA